MKMNKELANAIVESIKKRIVEEIENADEKKLKRMKKAMKRQRKNIALYELRNFYVRKVTKHSIGDGKYIVRVNNFVEIDENMFIYRRNNPKVKINLRGDIIPYASGDIYAITNALIDDGIIY